jgi:hypothetical protein
MKRFFLFIFVPLYLTINVFAIDVNSYELSRSDKIIVNKFIYKVDKIVQQKWSSYKNPLISKLSDELKSVNKSARLVAIFDEIEQKIIDIIVLSEIKKEEIIDDYSKKSTYDLDNIDINKVKNTWLSWYNEERNALGKKDYSYDLTLEKTALHWSKVTKSRWAISHKRNLSDSYYDYNKITSWFKDRWVVCKNIYRVTYSENIWTWYFSCKDWECTDELIRWIRETFDFYMWEKNKTNKAHYESVVNKYFTKIWLWLELQETSNWKFKYYLTVHYCTELL